MMHDGVGLLGMLVVGLLVVFPLWRICTRVGFPGWLSLAALLPFANLLLLYFIAFSQWPVERRSRTKPSEATPI